MHILIKRIGYEGITSIKLFLRYKKARAFALAAAHQKVEKENRINKEWHQLSIERLGKKIEIHGPDHVEPMMRTSFIGSVEHEPTLKERLDELRDHGPHVSVLEDYDDIITVGDVHWEINPIWIYEEE